MRMQILLVVVVGVWPCSGLGNFRIRQLAYSRPLFESHTAYLISYVKCNIYPKIT
jgi:hypothetical protein